MIDPYSLAITRIGAEIVAVSAALLGLIACTGKPAAGTPRPPLPATAEAATAAPQPPTWTTVNIMPAWWSFYEQAEGKSLEEQRALFRRHVVSAHPTIFVEGVLSRDPTAPFELDARLDALMAEMDQLAPTMRQLSQQLEADLPRHRASFERAFDDFSWDGQVYFMVSMFAFDGAVRMVDGEPTLMFGIDKVAKIHGAEASLAALFHHELFHIYHLVTRSPFEGSGEHLMYQALWAEGLAVHVAKQLNPAATAQQLVLSDAMIERADVMLPQLAREFRDNIDSQDEIFYRDWFRGAGKREDIPNRVGYYLGLRVAERLAETRSLQELAGLKDPELRKLIAEALLHLEQGPRR
jgi:hypothetical protein